MGLYSSITNVALNSQSILCINGINTPNQLETTYSYLHGFILPWLFTCKIIGIGL